MTAGNSVEIFFRFYSETLDEEATETLQAEAVDLEKGYYLLKSIPFYVPKIAFGDTVWAEFSPTEGRLIYRATARHSGNSTVHVILIDEEYDAGIVYAVFEETGCRTRKLNPHYIAVNVLAAIEYSIITSRLAKLVNENVIQYAESYLSEKHRG